MGGDFGKILKLSDLFIVSAWGRCVSHLMVFIPARLCLCVWDEYVWIDVVFYRIVNV